jgi:[protein-PII] uridylyltransferase
LREKLCDWTPEAVEEFVSKGYPGYWLGFDADVHEYHARTVSKATELGLALHIDTRVVAARGVTEILIYTADHPGLFTRISGAMALSDASIVDARITTFSDGMALDTFSIQDAFGGAFRDPGRLKRLQRNIEDSLAGKIIPRRELVARGKRLLARRTGVFLVSPGVLIDNKASTTHTVLEVNGCDRPGYLHDVTAALTDLGLQIGTAQISTYGERAVDVFYVKDIFGLKIENEDRLARIRKTILEAISPSSSSEAKDSVAAE